MDTYITGWRSLPNPRSNELGSGVQRGGNHGVFLWEKEKGQA
jgi:hypothetical protein